MVKMTLGSRQSEAKAYIAIRTCTQIPPHGGGYNIEDALETGFALHHLENAAGLHVTSEFVHLLHHHLDRTANLASP